MLKPTVDSQQELDLQKNNKLLHQMDGITLTQ